MVEVSLSFFQIDVVDQQFLGKREVFDLQFFCSRNRQVAWHFASTCSQV